MKQPATWEWELKAKKQGFSKIAGIDEVGRGAWAGPIVAAAYMFFMLPSEIELYDSKILSFVRRESLLTPLGELGVYGIGEATSFEIDRLGIQEAQYLAYRRAINRLPTVPDVLLLDGRPWMGCEYRCESIIDGDAKVASIAAASIVAKQYRDNLCINLYHKRYPEYGFDKHVGYGTKAHQEAIRTHGVLDLHRRSYKPVQAIYNSMHS